MSEQFKEAHKVETYKSMITISTEYYKALMLLNGLPLPASWRHLTSSAHVADLHVSFVPRWFGS
ncbi:hypothetical protein ACTMU2_29075 [Cupriavidus basilensis]